MIEHILVDGYNLMHQWEELRPARLKSLAAGREALLHLLTQYQDCQDKKITVVFDGNSTLNKEEKIYSSLQVIYSKSGQTADSVIERLIGQSPRPESYLVATDDLAEQSLAESLGARSISADAFRIMIKNELEDLQQCLETLHRNNQSFRRRNR